MNGLGRVLNVKGHVPVQVLHVFWGNGWAPRLTPHEGKTWESVQMIGGQKREVLWARAVSFENFRMIFTQKGINIPRRRYPFLSDFYHYHNQDHLWVHESINH